MTDLLDTAVADRLIAPPPTGEPAADVTAPDGRRRPALLRGRGLVGVVLVGIVLALGVLAPLIAPFEPNAQLSHAYLLSGNGSHWFGTDELDRDVFSRMLYGIRVDALVVFVAVPIGAFLGSLFGMLATSLRPADTVVQRAFDVLLAFPPIILAIGITAVVGTGVVPIIAVVIAVEIPIFGRLLRSSIVKVRELPFVEAAEAIGASRWWIMRRHILPNAVSPLVVQLALSMSVAIFLESAMSFLGIGVRPPEPSLGNIVAGSIANMDANPLYAVGPLAVIAVLVLGFQLVAQAAGAHRRA